MISGVVSSYVLGQIPQPIIKPRSRPSTTPTIRATLVFFRRFLMIAITASMAYSFFEGYCFYYIPSLALNHNRKYQNVRYQWEKGHSSRSDACLFYSARKLKHTPSNTTY